MEHFRLITFIATFLLFLIPCLILLVIKKKRVYILPIFAGLLLGMFICDKIVPKYSSYVYIVQDNNQIERKEVYFYFPAELNGMKIKYDLVKGKHYLINKSCHTLLITSAKYGPDYYFKIPDIPPIRPIEPVLFIIDSMTSQEKEKAKKDYEIQYAEYIEKVNEYNKKLEEYNKDKYDPIIQKVACNEFAECPKIDYFFKDFPERIYNYSSSNNIRWNINYAE